MTMQTHQHEYVCRARFSRTGALSFIGHLDLKGVFERAVRRAGLPVLYTQGFNPRPMIEFALPLGVGIDTECDYADIAMSVPVEPSEFIEKINSKLPDGLEVLSAVSIDEPGKSLMSVVTCASYRIEAPGITRAVLEIFGMENAQTTKKSKGREVRTDIRPLLIKPLTSSTPDRAEYMCLAGSKQNLRPDVLLRALCELCGYDRKAASEALVTRIALYGGDYPKIVSIEALT